MTHATLQKTAQEFLSSTDACTMRIHFFQGPIDGAVSRPFFEHTCLVLSSMPCWKREEAEAPWQYIIRYEVRVADLEFTESQIVPSQAYAYVEILTDGQFSNIYVEETISESSLLAVSPSLNIKTRVYRRIPGKFFFKKGAGYINVTVVCTKQFTYMSKYKWTYHMELHYKHPYFEQERQTEGKNLTFCDPPQCVFYISCNRTPQSIPDANYLSESILCKVRDLVPINHPEK